MKPDLIKHIEGENIGHFPVWMMRQAGRYLPQYRELRKQYSFWESVVNPKLAADISLMPLDTVAVDAVIFFSDILTLPHGVGVPVTMVESVGPVIERPLDNVGAFDVFMSYEPQKHTPYVSEALQMIKKRMPEEKALLGFAGAPWTVTSYLVEGKGTKTFGKIKGWMHRDPKGLKQAMDLLADATLKYLRSQVDSGAHMVQLFDTWINEMPRAFFVEYYRPVLETIFSTLKKEGIKSIYFTKGSSHLLQDFKGLSCNGFSVDSLRSLSEVDKLLGGQYFLQGNLDPTVLLSCEPGTVRQMTRQLVGEMRTLSKPGIMNLGHGILPGTSVENAKAFVDEARALWV